jgi:thiamine biosynthesis lipoprotein
MQETRTVMGMPVTVCVAQAGATPDDIESVFRYFDEVDARFSPFKPDSEVRRLNRGEIAAGCESPQLREVLALAEAVKRQTIGYFDIVRPDGELDPCGIVKGWAIRNAARMLAAKGFENFFVDAGGDIQASGKNAQGADWRVGIRSPFHPDKIVKVLVPRGQGVATSGTYLQGQHIYDPHGAELGGGQTPIVSLTIVGPDVLEADCHATAAFAMGRQGIAFIEALQGFEAYEIDAFGVARMTSGLGRYLAC